MSYQAAAPAGVIGQRAFDNEVRWWDRWGNVVALGLAAVWAAGLVVGFMAALWFLTLLGLAGLVLGIRRPALAFWSAALLSTIDTPMRLLLTNSYLRWHTFTYLLLVMAALFLPLLLRFATAQVLWFTAFAGLLVVELLVTADVPLGVQQILGASSFFGLVVCIFRGSVLAPTMWYWAGLACGILGAAGGLVYYLQALSVPAINPNAWAYFPVTATFMTTLGMFHARTIRRQAILGVLASICVLWVFLSGSRGSLMTALASMMFLFLAIPGLHRRTMLLGMALLLALALSAQFGGLQSRAIYRLQKLINPDYAMVSRTSGRSDLIVGGWQIFTQHPLGIGTGGYADEWENFSYTAGVTFGVGERKQAHAGWMKMLVENGFPGFLLFCAFLFSFLTTGWAVGTRMSRLIGGMVTLCLAVALVSTEFQTKGIWFLAAAGTVLLYQQVCAVRASRQRERSAPAWRATQVAGRV